MTNRSPIIEERESTHGAFRVTSRLAREIKQTIGTSPNYLKLTDIQREGLDMIASKLSRILAGDPHEKDHWDDIAGYASLVAEALAKKP